MVVLCRPLLRLGLPRKYLDQVLRHKSVIERFHDVKSLRSTLNAISTKQR